MIAEHLIKDSLPALSMKDTVYYAMQLMDDYDVAHLPVAYNNNFVGLISKDELFNADDADTLATISHNFLPYSVKNDAFFLEALKMVSDNQLTIIPVVNNSKELLGSISANNLLITVSQYLGNDERGAVIVLEIDRRHYSFGEISRLIETNDAYITQLNTHIEPNTGLVIATIKINKIEVSDIVATFQRYDYVIRHYFGEEQYANELRENYNHLMAYLNV